MRKIILRLLAAFFVVNSWLLLTTNALKAAAAEDAAEESVRTGNGCANVLKDGGISGNGSANAPKGSVNPADGSAKTASGADGKSESYPDPPAAAEGSSVDEGLEQSQSSSSNMSEEKSSSEIDPSEEEFKACADDLPGAIKQANIQFKRRDFKRCILLCDEILKLDKDNVFALALRGRALVATKKYDEATCDLNKVIAANAANHAVFGARALALLQTENYKQVIEDATKAIAENPKNQEYFIVRAIAEHRSKDNKRALDDISKGISLDPEGPNLPLFLLARADVYTELGKDDDCLKDLNKMIKLRPQDPQSYMNRANFYMKSAAWEKVVRDLDSVIDYALMGPLSNQALRLRAEAYRKISNYSEAETDYSSLLAGYPREVDYLYGRAESRYKLQKFEKALKDINLAIEINQTQSLLYELRALIYDALRMSDKAEADRQRAKELSTKNG